MKMRAWLKGIVLGVGVIGASWSQGGEIDRAFKAELVKVFPSSNVWENGLPPKRSSRAPQLVEVRNGESLLGYGVSLYPVSRSGPFRIVVAIAPNETVLAVRIPNYPHRRGRGVRKKSFLEQFCGVAYGEPLALGEQIDGVSGATSSGAALTGRVREALLLVHRYRNGKG